MPQHDGMSGTPQFSSDPLRDFAADLLVCLRFCTRVPLPAFAFEPPFGVRSLANAIRMLPVAGAIIGCIAAIVLWFGVRLGLPPALAALLTVAVYVLLTGGLHEDGLADFADCLGGSTIEQRLAIMKDSRIGAYGGLALVISILARFLALDALTVQGLGLACAVTISAAASSRLLALVPLYSLLPVRRDGLGAATATFKEQDLIFATVVTLIISLLPLFAGAGLLRVIIALVLSAASAYGVTVWTRRLINGQTGDIAGATQQIAEITSYIVFTAQP